MRIVYDITQTAEMGLAGWPGLPVLMEENNELFPEETALWQGLAPREKHKPKKISGLEEKSGFWDLLCLVGESHESQYDVLRTNLTNSNSRMACLALSGQGFHGQRQRPWRALAGNLHLSISVPLEMESGPGALGWTMLPAVAMMRVLKEFGIEDPYGIKWVNDIFCGNKKMGGVISALSVSEGQIRRGFLGLGLNVAVSPQIDSETC